AIEAANIRREVTGDIDVLMQDFKIHLAAMGMAGDGEMVALRLGHWKNIGVVREQDVKRARDDQPLGAGQVLRAHFLIVDSSKIDSCISEAKQLGLIPQDLDSNALCLGC